MMGQYIMDFKNEPAIHNLFRTMKNSFEYSFHQQHLQLHQHVRQQQQPIRQQQQPDQVLDLSSKRRDSTETRKTISPSSFEEGSPEFRHSPPHSEAQIMLRNHINIPKPAYTPEHAVQFHYNYEHSSPSSNIHKRVPLRSPQEIYERLEGSAPKKEKLSPTPEPAFFHPRPALSDHHAEDSNDIATMPSNISSASSTASSQKSPSSSNGGSKIMVVGRDGKLSRPFKAYPRDPLSLAAAGSIFDSASAEKYSVFRKRMLEQIHAANGGNPVINNPKMRRITTKSSSHETNNNEIEFEKSEMMSSPSSGQDKDEAYFERRKKNNAAAKKSRDRRRIKEDEIAIRAAFLESENLQLKFALDRAREQLSEARTQLSVLASAK